MKETLMEVFFPLVFFLLLVMLKVSLPPSSADEVRHYPVETIHPLHYFLNRATLVYVAQGSEGEAVMGRVKASMPPTFNNSVMSLASPSVLEAYCLSHDEVLAGVVFEPASGSMIRYQIRMDGQLVMDSTGLFTDKYTKNVSYVKSGFLSLQRAIDNAIIEYRGGNSSKIPIAATAFPSRAYFVDNFHDILISLGSFYLIMGYFPLLQRLLQLIVHEKEHKTKQGMMMMGLYESAFYASWSVIYMIISFIPTSLTTIAAQVLQFYPHSSMFLLFLFLWLYMQALILTAFFTSIFFDKVKTAGQFGGTAVLLLCVPVYPAIYYLSDPVALGFASLSPPVAFALGFKAFADAEAHNTGLVLSTMSSWEFTPFPFSHALLMLLLDCVILCLLIGYAGQVFPGEFGAPRPYCFCLSACKRKRQALYNPLLDGVPLSDLGQGGDLVESGEGSSGVTPTTEEAVSASLVEAIRIHALTKEFEKSRYCGSKQGVVAVQDLTLSVYEGQILALLGHNGGGKSTTLNILTGLLGATSGSVKVYGKELSTHLTEIRRTLGVCPQHDIVFDLLTVEEHLAFYAGLKGVPPSQRAAAGASLANELGIGDKLSARVKTLSGGQKRKLSVAISLIGNSKIIFLDEPSSGLDPASRATMWTMLQRYKAGRTIILTTHYMDEADVLGDRIAILSKGNLRCVGTSMFLKANFGIGYQLTINGGTQESSREIVQSHIPEGSLEQANTLQSLWQFRLPLNATSRFPALFKQLEDSEIPFHISLTTLGEVFLNLAHEQEQLTEGKQPDQSLPPPPPPSLVQVPADEVGLYQATFKEQMNAVFYKRLLLSWRSKVSLFMQLIFPSIYTLLFLIYFSSTNTFDLVHSAPPLSFTSNQVQPYASTMPVVAVAPTTCADLSSVTSVFNPLCLNTTKMDDLVDYLLLPSSKHIVSLFTNSSLRLMLHNTTAIHALPAALSFLSNLELSKTGPFRIETSSWPLPFVQDTLIAAIGSLIGAMLVGMAFVQVPITIAATIVKEREAGSEQVQVVMARAEPFWLANFIFDFLCQSFSAVIALIMFAGFGNELLLGANTPLALLLFVAFGASTVSSTYFLSFFFQKSLTVQTVLSLLYGVLNIVVFFCVAFISLAGAHVGAAVFVLSMFPPFGLFWGLFMLGQLNRHRQLAEFNREPPISWQLALSGEQDGYSYTMGAVLAGMFLVTVVCLFVVILFHKNRCRKFRNCECTKASPGLATAVPLGAEVTREDEDVIQERSRPTSDCIQLTDLRKVFHSHGKYTVAVDRLTLGVTEGCFGLLGPNGAGKTTVVKMLAGEVAPTSGQARVRGFQAGEPDMLKLLGLCPQQPDGLFLRMTGREHLQMYGRFKGIPKYILGGRIQNLMEGLHFAADGDKLVEKYSGGTKRKLALAIALLASPPVALLDEPSCGLDPEARRGMWDFLLARREARAYILTTHMMEEAEALCSRVGIMVNSRLACLGTTQHLKEVYGGGYFLELKTREGAEDVARALVQKLSELSQDQKSEEKMIVREELPGLLKYAFPPHAKKLPLSVLFAELEAAKLRGEVLDYSVCLPTLEQVFVSFAKDQADPV